VALIVFLVTLVSGGVWSLPPWIALLVVGVSAHIIDCNTGECEAE
jgi:hypothetical protein